MTRNKELTRQGMPQALGPQRLALFEVPGLRIEFIALDEQFVRVIPDEERPAREELPTPEDLPADWKLYRRGEGYSAATADGQEVFTWYQVPQPELSYACREQEVPQLEAMQLGDQPAILIRSADASNLQLFLRAGDTYYLIGGKVALNELVKLATSFPWKN